MTDIRQLKKQLEELFDEGNTDPSDVDIFAQPDPYEYALSERVDSHEDYKIVDVDAIHAEMLKEYMLSNPELCENQEEYTKIKSFLDDYETEFPQKGNKYVYASLMVMPPMNFIGIYHFNKSNRLVDINDEYAYFEIQNKIEKFPKSGSIKGDAFSHICFLNSLDELKKLEMIIKMKFPNYKIKVSNSESYMSESELSKIRIDSKSAVPKKDKPVHKSDSPEQIKANLKQLSKQFNVELVDDFIDYIEQSAKKTDGEHSLLSKSIREDQDIDEARGDIRKVLAGVALLAGIWGVNNQLAQQAYDASPQLQKLTAYLEVAREHDDQRMISQLEKRIVNHEMRLKLGKGEVMGADGQPIDVVYDRDVKEQDKMDPDDDPCWSGYKMVGTKMKGGREVPNCVPGKKGE